MKTKYIISLVFLVFALLSCEKDLLNKVDPNTVSNTEFWRGADDFNTGLVAAYQPLQYRAVSGGDMNLMDRVRTDMSRSFNFYNDPWPFTTFTWPSTAPYIGDRWKALYVGVYRANQVIGNLKSFQPNDDFSQGEIDEIMGQARFLRALYYFWLANSYNGAVIHYKVPETDEEIQRSMSDYNAVLNDIVIPDFKYAASVLPESWDNERGRATWGAATGFLGKVYLYQEKFDSAAIQFKDLIESDIYSLVADIGENFTLEGEHNVESIFEVSYSDVLFPAVNSAQKEILSEEGDRAGQATNKASITATDARGGLRMVVPTFYATELFLRDSIDVSLAINLNRRWSNRAYWSIAFIGQDSDFYLDNTRDAASWHIGGAECAYWKKGTNWYRLENEDSWNNTGRSGINERMLRLADVKLMYAEALLRRAGSNATDLQTALEQVDDVRARAGVITLQGYMSDHQDSIPVLHQRGPAPYISNYTLLSRESLLTHIQCVERPLELSFEGNSIRWHDLRRWGMIGEVLNRIADVDYAQPWIIQWWDGTNIRIPDPTNPVGDGLVTSINLYQEHQHGNYNSQLHDFFDIPIDEFNANMNINE